MTQTIDERARELLAVQLDIGLYHDDAERVRTAHDGLGVVCAASALAALTEALTRIEELEGALEPFAQALFFDPSGADEEIAGFTWGDLFAGQVMLGDLRRATAITKGIKE